MKCGTDFRDLLVRVGCFAFETPHHAGPRGIAGRAADDVDVHLAHLVADARNVELLRPEMIGDEPEPWSKAFGTSRRPA